MNIGLTVAWSRPYFTRTSQRRLARWRRYSTKPFIVLEQMGWFPDFVLIDGRFRCACALQMAIEVVARQRRATVLFDDYFKPGRERYRAVEQWLGKPERIGRAAFFNMRPSVTRVPTSSEIEKAAKDYE